MPIVLSPQHGVNPSVSVCFYCGQDKNELVLPGRLPGDEEAPRRAVWNKEPCDECKSLMQMGIMLISVREDKPEENPYRTERIVVVSEDYVKRVITPPSLVERLLKTRVSFVPDEAWVALGLPMEARQEESHDDR